MKSYSFKSLYILLWVALILAVVCFKIWGQDAYRPDYSYVAGANANATSYYFVDPSGNNSNNGKSPQRPFATIAAALTAATGGTNVVDLMGGIYDVTTNVINVPNNVTLRNGTIKSMVDLDVYGVAVVPGNNSVIENLSIIGYTNTVYWAGLGSRSTSIGTPQKTFTNAIVRNVFIYSPATDCWYVDNTSVCTADIYASKLSGVWDQIAEGGHNNAQSRFRFLGCTIINDGALANQDLTFGQGSIVNVGSGQWELIACYGITTNQQVATGLQRTSVGVLTVSGGNYQVNGTNGAAAAVYYTGITGQFNMNGTNVSTSANTFTSPALMPALLVSSNTPPTGAMINGDIRLWSSNGVAYLIQKSAAGTVTTNKIGL